MDPQLGTLSFCDRPSFNVRNGYLMEERAQSRRKTRLRVALHHHHIRSFTLIYRT